jgi:hypothetical protein
MYVIIPVGGNGVKPTDRTDLTTLFMEQLAVLAERTQPSEKEFPMVKNEECSGDKPCEVVWVQITQETGGYNYTVQSRLIKAPSGTVDSHILERPLFCHFNAAVDGDSPSDLHKSRITFLARQLISHDKAAHQ